MMDAILDALPPLQLPPLQLGQYDNQHRDRPLPLEPSAPREPYASSVTSQYGDRQQASSSQQSLPLQQSSGQDRGLSAIQDFTEQLRQSIHGETQHTLSSGITSPHCDILNTHAMQPVSTTMNQEYSGSNVSGPSMFQLPAIGTTCSTNTVESGLPTIGRAYPPILPWTDETEPKPERQIMSRDSPQPQQNGKGSKIRRKWTAEETKDLLTGCTIHGVGNWKKVLDDTRFNFNNRSSVDLKDRFRTCFPTEYKNHFGKKAQNSNAVGKASDLSTILVETEVSPKKALVKQRKSSKKRDLEAPVTALEKYGFPKSFPKAPRRERKPFTAEEDDSLLKGFQIHGALWSKIQGDKDLNLGHRRSTDLRDRFRNAYPEKYEKAGFRGRPKNPPKPPRSGPALGDESISSLLEPEQSSSISPIDDGTQYDQDITDALDEFDLDLGKSNQLDDRNDDDSQKDEFSVTMMQDLLGGDGMPLREWDDSHDPILQDDSSLFSPSHHHTPPSTSSTTVEATLAEELGSNGLTQFDEQSFLNTAANSTLNRANNKQLDTESNNDRIETAHDLVRWEDMVTHPIFVLEASIPLPSSSSSHLHHHHNHHGLVGLDETVTLAPLNPALFGGPNNSGLPSFSCSSTPPIEVTAPPSLTSFDDHSGSSSGGNLTSVSDLLQPQSPVLPHLEDLNVHLHHPLNHSEIQTQNQIPSPSPPNTKPPKKRRKGGAASATPTAATATKASATKKGKRGAEPMKRDLSATSSTNSSASISNNSTNSSSSTNFHNHYNFNFVHSPPNDHMSAATPYSGNSTSAGSATTVIGNGSGYGGAHDNAKKRRITKKSSAASSSSLLVPAPTYQPATTSGIGA